MDERSMPTGIITPDHRIRGITLVFDRRPVRSLHTGRLRIPKPDVIVNSRLGA